MAAVEKRIELMRKKNDASLLQNEIMKLESELRELEIVQEDISPMEVSGEQRQRRHLPNIPLGMSERSEAERPPRRNLYDDSSIGGTYTPLPTPAPVTVSMTEAGNKLATSTPKPPQTKDPGGTGIKVKAATLDGTGS